ncbi:universal stress protein [Membranicola marinus]|uniref:Universal stress protein n=1 Tax=Membranihabitans marinus TaxID=1227546 RepID=A0A953HS67_9BACT|nr:universal stress protein [Membranihabitans marinus]MBY5957400.1 universal stress protein [Membranihabitans marinus]
MRTVFLPNDFSHKSENAMKYAADMFHNEPIHYVLIHSYDIPYQPNEVIISSILETLKEDVDRNLLKQEEILKSYFRNEANVITKRVGVGSVVDMINYNEDMNPDFVVMGTRGTRQSASGYLIGSNTLQVLKSVDVPVLAIPENCRYSKLKQIVFGSDMKAIAHDVIKPLTLMLERTDADLTVVHVGDISAESKNNTLHELKSLLGERLTSFVQVASTNIDEELRRMARENDADLLVLVDRKRNFLQRLFHKSVTRKMGWKTEIPMLVLHE